MVNATTGNTHGSVMTRSGTLRVRGTLIAHEELACIAMAIRNADPEMAVTIREPAPTVEELCVLQFVDLKQVIDVILQFAPGYAAGKVVDAIVTQAQKGWQILSGQATIPHLVSREVNIYGPSGEVLRRVTIKGDGTEIEDRPTT
jgi:hypothetical protein